MADAARPGRTGWRRIRSARGRIVVTAALLVTVVIALLGVVTTALQERLALDALDRSLAARADALVAGLGAGLPVAAVDSRWQLVDPTGRVVDGSAGMLAAEPLLPDLDPGPGPTGAVTTSLAEGLSPLGDAIRVRSVGVVTADGPATLHVVGDLDRVEESVELLVTVVAGLFPVALLAVIGVLWRTVGRTLAPVEEMRVEVEAIRLRELDRRVPRSGVDDELDRLAATMNEMLDRLEGAVGLQRRFLADAAHELRSPVTRLRTQLEVRAVDDDPSVLLDVLHVEIIRLGELVDDLLLLARLDEGIAPPHELVDLDDVVLREAEHARATATVLRGRTPVTIDTSRVSGADVRGDRVALGRVVRNLLDNAVRHAATSVSVALTAADDVELVVADDGPGVPPAARERVFQRFARLDGAGGGGEGSAGVGLGLAIVRDVVAAHGGDVVVDDSPTGGARFAVTLPLPA